MESADLRWRKSSFSGNGGDCVEVAQAADGTVLVRDTKNRNKAPHEFTATEWDAFLKGVRNREFDLDGSGRLV